MQQIVVIISAPPRFRKRKSLRKGWSLIETETSSSKKATEVISELHSTSARGSTGARQVRGLIITSYLMWGRGRDDILPSSML